MINDLPCGSSGDHAVHVDGVSAFAADGVIDAPRGRAAIPAGVPAELADALKVFVIDDGGETLAQWD